MKTTRRSFLKKSTTVVAGSFLLPAITIKSEAYVHTVTGKINPAEMGITLPHEHLMVDFIGAKEVSPDRYNRKAVLKKVQPYLKKLKAAGCHTLVECTPAYLGRDAGLMQKLSKKSGVQILSNTGYYGARNNLFLPAHAFTETADQLASRWINEFENGLDNTGIKPGFIKIGVDRGNLSDLHQKLITAACRTHLATGLTIAAHTGTAPGAFDQLEILNKEGVDPSAWIWVHAQNEKDKTLHVMAARRGAWVEFDGYGEGKEEEYYEMLLNMKQNKVLHRVLISQDAGWYHVGEEDGGNFKSFTPLLKKLLPYLKKHNFRQEEIEQLVVKNPMEAYQIRKRKA